MLHRKLMRAAACGLLAVAAGLVAFEPAQAESEFDPAIRAYVEQNVNPWLSDPKVVEAVRKQNEKHGGLTAAQIDAMDAEWRTEVKAGGGALMSRTLASDLSKFLQEKKAASKGAILEVFVMDNKGLNVGQSDATSDYMQGDEAKWQKTYGSGGDALFIDAVEYDESAQGFLSQASKTIVDPDTGKPIGAVTIGLSVEKLL